MTLKTKERQSLRLVFRGALMQNGKHKKVTRSYTNTSYDATAEELHQAGTALSGLYKMELMDVTVVEESLLTEEE